MNQSATLTPNSSTDPDKPDVLNGDVDIRSLTTRNATIDDLNLPNMDLPGVDAPDWEDDDDESATETGLNPDPDYEKMGGDVELLLPEEDDDDELSSDDADDDRV